ncbi:STAS domain-containing protein [Lentzea sp. E54]|uniref:STAS domain-containing protein n=1 Tax=Lentzea xerophila TaxID=3435883 RepID=UPI003DA6C8C7
MLVRLVEAACAAVIVFGAWITDPVPAENLIHALNGQAGIRHSAERGARLPSQFRSRRTGGPVTDQNITVTLDPHPTGFITVLRVAGELDFHTTPRFREVLDTVDLGLGTGLVVDATDLVYCDSTGISVLVVAYRRAKAAGGSFGLAGLNPELVRLLRILGLEQVFPLHPTVEEAVASPRS